MTNAHQLSRRMVRGFVAALALIGGLHFTAYGVGTSLAADERELISRHRGWEQARATVALASLAATDLARAGPMAAGRAAPPPDAAPREAMAGLAVALEGFEGSATLPELASFAAQVRALASAAQGDTARAAADLEARAGPLLVLIDRAIEESGDAAAAAAARTKTAGRVGVTAGLASLVVVALIILRPMLSEVTRVTRTLEETQAKLAHSALHDHLTGLPNRRYVEDHLRHTLAAAGRAGHMVAVLQIDLDGFKQINDRFGHAVGDVALASVARLMQSAIRRSDFLGRTGGDEFVVIAAESRNPRGLEILADRLIATIGSPIEIGAQRCEIGASVGIALAPPLEADSERLLSQADAALYAAKDEGRGLFRFHPDARAYLDVHYPARLASVPGGRRAG